MRTITIAALVALLFGLAAARPSQPGVNAGGAASVADTAATASVAVAAASGVTIKDFEFQPRELTVKAGATVTWTNQGDNSHTVTADDGSFESPTLAAGKTYVHRFTRPGTYHYHCAFHGGKGGEGMSGTVVVTR
jgi:plastocyanin